MQRRCTRWILLGLCLGLLSLVFWVSTHKDLIVGHIEQTLRDKLGSACTIGGMTISWNPWPVVRVHHFQLNNDAYSLDIPALSLRPALTKLCVGVFDVGTLILQDPSIHIHAHASSSDAFDPTQLPSLLNDVAGSLPSNATLIVQNATVLHESARVDGFDCVLNVRNGGVVEGNILVRAVTSPHGLLQDIFWIGTLDLANLYTGNSQGRVRVRLSTLDHRHAVTVRTAFARQEGEWQAETRVHGAFTKDEQAIPFSFAGNLALPDLQHLAIRQATLTLGYRDSGQLSADYAFDAKKLQGVLRLNHVSLTEWLGFGRSLPPGLMHALDHITDGSLDFTLSPKGLVVPRVSAHCADAFFEGRGGVADWAKPVVFLDMQAAQVDLLKGIPEAGCVLPPKPEYGHGPLTPESFEPGEEASVGYDIRLGANQVLYGPLTIHNARVRIHPGPKAKDAPIALDVKALFYEGRMQGSLLLGGIEETTYAIQMAFADVNGAPLGKAMPRIPLRKGKWNATLAITSLGTSLDGFLKELRGNVRVEGRQGEVALASKQLAFTTCQARLAPLQQGQFASAALGLDGHYGVVLDIADRRLELGGIGKIWFGETQDKSGVEFYNLETSVRMQTKAVPGELVGKMLLQWSGSKLVANKVAVSCDGGSFAGQASAQFQKEMTVSGKGNVAIKRLSSILSLVLGKSFSIPQLLERFQGETQFLATAKRLHWTDLSLQTELGKATGDMSIDLAPALVFMPHIRFERIDVDRLFGQKGGGEEKGEPLARTWRKLDGFAMMGLVTVGQCVWKKFVVDNLRLPFSLHKGVFFSKTIQGQVFDGSLKGQVQLEAAKDFLVGIVLAVEHMDIAHAAKAFMDKAQISGTANISATMKSACKHVGELVRNLSGTWSLRVKDGRYQSLKKNGQPQGKPLLFSVLQASGQMDGGIVESKNITLAGDSLALAGKGEYNIPKETIDLTLTVDMKGFPRFPIYIEGPVEKPKTAIGAGSLIVNAIGGLFTSLFSVFR
ncbi:MAG: hypothetical protein IJS54_07000 [Desulfovibrio sp.]|nr:hypothetical protein [Desulfovibrio sp.]